MADFHAFIQSLDDNKAKNQPAGFIISLKGTTEKIVFNPDFKEVETAVIDTFDIMIKASHDIPRFEHILEPEDEERVTNLRPTILEAIVDEMKETVRTVIQSQSRFPIEYIKEYDKFIYLIDGRAETEIEDYIQEKHEFEEFAEKVKFCDNLSHTLLTTLPKEINLGMFELHCEDLIISLNRKTTILREHILKKMSSDHQHENKLLCQEFEAISNTALSSPNNTEELVTLKEKVRHIRTVIMLEKEKELNKAAKRLVFLSDYLQFTTAEMKLNTKTFQWFAKMPKVFEEHESIVKEKTADYQKALKLRRERFLEELEASNNQVDDFYTYGNVDDLPKYMKKAQTLQTKLDMCQEKIQQFNMEEGAFDWEKTNYPLWQATVDKLKPFLGLYETSMAFMNKQKIWFESPMGTHDPKDIESEVNSSWELVSKLENEFSDIPAARELVINVREKIEEFRGKMPVIRTLGNPGFRDRHWENVSNTVGFPVKGGSNLFQILDMGLDEYVSKFEKISEAATKEFNLEKAMEQMVDDWSDMEFNITPYDDTGTYTLSSMDAIQILLDDHIVKTQTMRGSPFIKPFEEQIGKWEVQLLLLQEIMDEWLKVQGIWLYLEPIFGSPDIMAQMPEEGRRFTTVDKNWRDIMKAAIVDKHVLKVVEIDRILEKLKKSNELLDLIGKGLNDYLERKRQCFPRFFFLSNSELLEILSETKDPTRVQVHLRKCFEGIATLEFDEHMQVTNIKSAFGETIPLTNKISTVKARGQVDKWLLELEIQMRTSLKKQITGAFEEYTPSILQSIVSKFPNQAIICANSIFWTSKIHLALESPDNGALHTLLSDSQTFTQALSDMILQESNPVFSRIYSNLLLSQGYSESIITNLLEDEILSVSDFVWISKIRYYVVDNAIELHMMSCKVPYGYEYLSAYTKLVMTPLTERCYQILLMALDMNKGGLVSGETATGKTESIKDLAKAVAKQCVGFNCSEDFHYRAFSKFVKGLASCGAWSCFDEFHRVDGQVLSVIAQQILIVQRALVSDRLQINFEGSELKILKGCAIFVTADSLQNEGGNIPDNVKVLFRPVTMFSPDFAMIAEHTLRSQGFKECQELAKKLASMVELCDGLLSSQPHYEFGLRSIISILRSAGELKKISQDEDEHYLISKALQTVKYCELLPQDQKMFRDILTHLFHQCPPDPLPDDMLKNAIIAQCSANNLEGTAYFLSKVQQLYDMMDLSEGVMLLGEPFGGKTMAWKILAASLKSVQMAKSQPTPACVVLNPKAIKIDQLYGYFENDEWRDGILAKNFRQFASMPKNQRKWLIFDGPVDSEWIENMNTVLDENKKLCLMSGEIIPLPDNTNLIFEATDVESASPATISRCGVLYMDPKCLDWNLIVRAWIRKFPKFIPESIRTKLSSMFQRFCTPLLKLVSRFSTLKTAPHHLITSLINLIDCFLDKMIKGSELKGMSEHEQTPLFEGLFFFSCIWSIGGVCDTEAKAKFDVLFRELLRGVFSESSQKLFDIGPETSAPTKPYAFPLPSKGSVFDYKLTIGTKPDWSLWEEDVDTSLPLPRDIFACQLVIPNPEYAKYQALMTLLVENCKPFLLVGSPGTGKSVYFRDLLHRKLDSDKFASVSLFFTSNTTAYHTQETIMSKLDKRRKGVYGPPLGKMFIVHVDDLNLPAKDDVGCQPPVEILRQLLDHQTWYDNKELFPMKLIEMQVSGALRPPDGSSKSLSNRFIRHFNVVNVDQINDDVAVSIFSRIVLWHLDTRGFSKEFDPCIDQIVKATLDIHKYATCKLLPTPYHPHYIFSLKEFSRVISGVLLSVPETMLDLNAMKRLWIHETMRIYYDRLSYGPDRESFLTSVKSICMDKLKVPFDEICNRFATSPDGVVTENDLRKLLFCDFNEEKNDDRFYKEVTDINEFRKVAMLVLDKHNAVSRKPMNLVLFDFALEHLCRISRILKQPESHTMLVGVGGSGRQSLARLAAYVAGHEFHEVEMSKDYDLPDWRLDLKAILKKVTKSVCHHVLFVYDNQMTNEQFIQDLNDILLSGEIPNLFNNDEKLEVIENMRNMEKHLDKYLHTDGSGPALFNLFIRRVKEFVHIVFAMSPFSNSFKDYIARFPALLNCCTINWVHQWPNDALNFVSRKSLSGTTLDEVETDRCVELCEFLHNSTINLSKIVRKRHNLFNYVTPASFLELNSLFTALLKQYRQRVHETKRMYEVSLEKLKGAEAQVSVMQEEMAAIQPNLTESSKEVDAIMAIVEKEQLEVNEMEKVVKAEDAMVAEKKALVDSISANIESEFNEVNAIFEPAIDTLAALGPNELAALRGVKSPVMCLRLIMEAIAIVKGIKPDRVPDGGTGSKMIDDYWIPTKRLLADPKFIENLCTFDKDSFTSKTAKLVREKYIGNPEMNPEKAKNIPSAIETAVRGLYMWLMGMDMFEKVSRSVAPKKENLQRGEVDYHEALDQLNTKKQAFKEASDKLKNINDTLHVKKQKKAELENEVDLCSRKLERAEQLITGFGGEREKWASMSKTMQTKLNQLVGDMLLAAGTVAYLGAFPNEERQIQIKEWQEKAIELGIVFSEDWSLRTVLGNEITIQNWLINGLLMDEFSTDNGIILTEARRWVLMVDPEGIANRWIKTSEKAKGLNVLKQSDKDFLRTLENCIQFGNPVLLENVGDYLDPALEPLLQKQTFQQGGSVCIKLGESTIEYSKDFKMYITTTLRNPHFPPETNAKITMVNFSITKEGLVDQLLGIIVARERPELEEERSQVNTQINENKKNLEDIEHKILDVLYTSKGNILEDENAIKNLSSSKVLANEIMEKQHISFATFKRIKENRQEYLNLTNYAVMLYFTITKLSFINNMYQYSLSWFINLFCTSIDVADKSEELSDRLQNIQNHFLKALFANTAVGLFEKDKIIFSFLLCCQLAKNANGIIGSTLWHLLMKYEPELLWEGQCDGIPMLVRNRLESLSEIPVYQSCLAKVSEIDTDPLWLDLWSSPVPNMDDPAFKKLSSFERLVLLCHFRSDKIIRFMRQFVRDVLGNDFVGEEPLDVTRVFGESIAATPLIFLLGKEVDPLKYILRFSEEMGFTGKKLKMVTLGKGQEEKARDMIKESYHSSTWVVLLNCHMVPQWMDDLEYLVDDLNSENTNPDFRLWITTRPHEEFSVPTLQSGIKIALEEPPSVKTNMIRHLYPDKVFSGVFNASSDSFKRICFGLAMFHAIINERRSYINCGWNQQYNFSEPDYDVMIHQLQTESIQSTDSLHYLLSNLTYGGRMEDELDMRTLETIVKLVCSEELWEKDMIFDANGIYHTKALEDHETLMNYLATLPMDVSYNLMHMSEVNHRNKEEQSGLYFIRTLKKIFGHQGDQGQSEFEEDYLDTLRRKIVSIVEGLPKVFDLIDDHQDILPLVLDQELQKFNTLIETITESLASALKGIDGLSLISDEVNLIIESIQAGDIPSCWESVMYPSIEDLEGFLNDLVARTTFLRSWQDNGLPTNFWLAALFEPGDFLIAILYIKSLECGKPFHELTLECCFDLEGPGILIRDLYLVGAGWDAENNLLVEANRDEIYSQMPIIRLVPIHEDDLDENNKFACPLFQNSERSGDENFIIDLQLPTLIHSETWILRGTALLCQRPIE
ncbi:dynein axonemal heavy chain 7-like [Tigriopus californicus]|nr:dynein axonemal heavy chain 7-like [Tigriopus californicus]